MWMASGVSRRNCDVWWSWSGGDVCAGGDVGGDRVCGGRSCGGSCDSGGDCCEVDKRMVGLEKLCWLVPRRRGQTVAGGGEAMDGDGEGCETVAVVTGLGTGLLGSCGAGCWCGCGSCGESLSASWGCDEGCCKGGVTGGNAEKGCHTPCGMCHWGSVGVVTGRAC